MQARWLFVLWAVVGTATAQEVPGAEPDTRQEAAGKVLAAMRKGDGAALKALAQRDKPDPWLVADDLWASGNYAVALEFAKAAPRKDVEKLPEYVASRSGRVPNASLRTALANADEAFGKKDPRGALAALESVTPSSEDLVSVVLLELRGRALHMLERFEDSSTAYRSAAQAAERLGWLARAAAIFNDLGDGAYARSDRQGALQAWKLLLKQMLEIKPTDAFTKARSAFRAPASDFDLVWCSFPLVSVLAFP